MAWIVVIFSHFEKAILFYHLSGDSRISLWERDKRIEGCREQAHRYVLLIKHKMGESPRTWAWIMHVKVWGGAEVLKYWGEFVRKQRDEEVKRHWGLEKACCVESNHISLLMELARRTCFRIATHTCGLFAAADLSLSLYPDYCSLTVDRMWHNGLHKNPWLYYTGARKWKRHTHTKKNKCFLSFWSHVPRLILWREFVVIFHLFLCVFSNWNLKKRAVYPLIYFCLKF